MSRRSSGARRRRRPGRRPQTQERAATTARGGVARRGSAATTARGGNTSAGARRHNSARRRRRAGRRRQTQGIAGRNASAFAGWGWRRRVTVRAGAGSRKGRARKPTSCKGSRRFSDPKRYKRWVLVRRRGGAGNAGGVSTQIAPQCVSPGFRRECALAETHTFSSYGRVPAPIPRRTACLGEAAARGGVAGRGGVARRRASLAGAASPDAGAPRHSSARRRRRPGRRRQTRGVVRVHIARPRNVARQLEPRAEGLHDAGRNEHRNVSAKASELANDGA